MARTGQSKEDIREYLRKKFGYDLSRSVADVRRCHVFDSRCSYSVTTALTAFLDSHDYESAVRNAVSLGGDVDTEACIAGGIAEAYYGEIPKAISDFCNSRVDLSLRRVVNEFRESFTV